MHRERTFDSSRVYKMLFGGVFIFVDGARSIHRFAACPRTVLRMPCFNYRGLDGQELAVRAGYFKEMGVVQIITSHNALI